MSKHTQIVAWHLFDDFSGSPRVLANVLRGLHEKGVKITLFTSASDGALRSLDELEGINRHEYSYSFSQRAAVTMWRYAITQVRSFFSALRYGRKADIFYINTILPVGPAVAARLLRKRIIYHYHENASAKGAVYSFLAFMMQRLADKIICVSSQQASNITRKKNVHIIPNAVPPELAQRLDYDPHRAFDSQRVLMLSSLKAYKGTREFIALASRLPQFKFCLVINDSQAEIDHWLKSEFSGVIPGNLEIHPRQDDVSPFYNKSSIVLNLSDPRSFVETFGMTAIEAMTAGLPVIGPEVGGIAEIIEEGVNGLHIDVADSDKLVAEISRLLTDKDVYLQMAQGAILSSRKYSSEAQIESVYKLLQ